MHMVMTKAELHRKWNKVRRETGFRSQFEADLAKDLPESEWLYEPTKIPYRIIRYSTYKPDFVFPRQCFILEAKGRFDHEDRDKITYIRTQYPDLDLRMVFYSNDHITRQVTYGDWCNKMLIPWSVGTVPPSWFNHEPSEKQRQAFYEAMKDVIKT